MPISFEVLRGLSASRDEITLDRALQLFQSGTTTFRYGPPPFGYDMEIVHTGTGQKFHLMVSEYMDEKGIEAVTKALKEPLEGDDPDRVRAVLCYVHATSEWVGAGMRSGMTEGEQ